MRYRPYIPPLLALLASCSIWFYVQYILIPHQRADASQKQIPRGNLSDLYPRWLGARELLLHGRDPYSAEITREIQIGYYGRPLDAARPNDPKDQEGFAYPVYVVFLLAPTVKMPFSLVRDFCLWLFLAITMGSALLWMDSLGWRVSLSTRLVWILLTASCFPTLQGIKLQQLSILVAALLALFANLLRRGKFASAGALLAVATIKPQLALLPVAWTCIWSIGHWRVRQRVVWSFTGTLALLVIAGEVVLPGWIREFRSALSAYRQYTGGLSILDVSLSTIAGRGVAIILATAFIVLAWRMRKASSTSTEFQWVLSLSLAITVITVPMFAPYNQVLLLPALMMIVRSLGWNWQRSRVYRVLIVLTAAAVFEQWVTAVLLIIGLFVLPGAVLQKAWGLPFYSSLAIPLTVLASLLISRMGGLSSPADSTTSDSRALRQGAASE